MIRNVIICTNQIPFTTGGAEAHVEGLRRALIQAGYNAEVVALPFKWYPPDGIMRSALAWRMLDLSEANGKPVDLVIGMKFPAYLVAHERKVLWIIHQHRSAYNLWNTPFDDLSTYPEGPRVREWIKQADNRFIPEARKVFANSKTVADRLRRYNKIESEPLYHPPPRAESLRCGEQGASEEDDDERRFCRSAWPVRAQDPQAHDAGSEQDVGGQPGGRAGPKSPAALCVEQSGTHPERPAHDPGGSRSPASIGGEVLRLRRWVRCHAPHRRAQPFPRSRAGGPERSGRSPVAIGIRQPRE